MSLDTCEKYGWAGVVALLAAGCLGFAIHSWHPATVVASVLLGAWILLCQSGLILVVLATAATKKDKLVRKPGDPGSVEPEDLK